MFRVKEQLYQTYEEAETLRIKIRIKSVRMIERHLAEEK